jgi:UDP-glucose 4-epimerase
MKILITGGAGFIGSHLSDVLIKENHDISIVDNLLLGSMDNIKHLTNLSSFSFYKEDILNINTLKNIFSDGKFDIIFHLAANSDIAKSLENPLIDFNNTFMTTFNILTCMREYNVKILFLPQHPQSMARQTEKSQKIMVHCFLPHIMVLPNYHQRHLFHLLPRTTD